MTHKRKGSPLYIGIAVGVLLLSLVVVVVVFGLQMVSLSRQLEARDEALMGAVRDNTASLDFLKQSMMLLARDSNEVRERVKLPLRDYPILRPSPSVAASHPDSGELFLNGLDLLMRTQDRTAARRAIDGVVASPALLRIERSAALTARRAADDRIVLSKGGSDYFTISYDPVSERLDVVDFLGMELTAAAVDARVEEFLGRRIGPLDRHFSRLSAGVETLRQAAAEPSVRQIANANRLSITAPSRVDGGYRLLVRRAGSTVLTVNLDDRTLAVRAADRRYRDARAFLAAFPAVLRTFDLKSAAEARVAAARRRIESLRGDKTFMLALSSRKITFASTPRQDIDYFYYDFTDARGARIGSFAVQKKLATIYLMDANGLTIRALSTGGRTAGEAAGAGGDLVKKN